MAKRPLMDRPWDEDSEKPDVELHPLSSMAPQESLPEPLILDDEPQYDGLKSKGQALTNSTGLVLAVPHETPDAPLIEKVNIVAPKGVQFHCCGIHQQTEVFTTRVICSQCGKVYQLTLKLTPSRLKGKPLVQMLPSGSKVSLTEDYREQMTSHGFLVPAGAILKVAIDHGVLPVDRSQELLVEFRPSDKEWPTDKEPPLLSFPVPVALLARED